MFGHDTFYFSTTRKMVVYFGTLFNNIHISRTDDSNNVTHLFRVPMQYGPKDKEIARVLADPEIQREVAITLPRLSFELDSIMYDPNRKLSSLNRIVRKNDNDANKLKRMYNKIPYNFNFSLYCYAKHVEDGTKIIEQIIPFFTPEFTSTVNLVPEMDITLDLPVVLTQVGLQDSYEGGFDERRMIVWTLNFMIKGFMFAPIVDKPIIKISNTQFFIGNTVTTNTQVMSVSVTPGLDANGNATTNSSITIPYANIEIDDTYGFIETWSDSTDANTST